VLIPRPTNCPNRFISSEVKLLNRKRPLAYTLKEGCGGGDMMIMMMMVMMRHVLCHVKFFNIEPLFVETDYVTVEFL
jgi:hypothetical protein